MEVVQANTVGGYPFYVAVDQAQMDAELFTLGKCPACQAAGGNDQPST